MSLTRQHSSRAALAFATALSLAMGVDVAKANEDAASNLLKAMSEYLASEQAISFAFDSDLEVVTPELQKLKFASSGTVSLVRPDKIHVTRTGGFSDVEMVFDGKQFSVFGKNSGAFAQMDAPGTIDELVDNIRDNLGLEAPGADLLLSNVYDQLMPTVTDAKDLGSGIIGGVECNHLAFRTPSVDWEIWIAMGDHPYPCRYVITSKLSAQAPEYTVQISHWATGTEVAPDHFVFEPGSATHTDFSELHGINEVPEEMSSEGGAQ